MGAGSPSSTHILLTRPKLHKRLERCHFCGIQTQKKGEVKSNFIWVLMVELGKMGIILYTKN